MQPGVNLVGFLEAESGLGEVARRLGVAIERAGIPLAAIPYRGTHGRQEHPAGLVLQERGMYKTNLICLNADSLGTFAHEVGNEFFGGRYTIGVWFWETSALRPQEQAATRFLDELWVASDYVRQAIEPSLSIPVHVVPVPMEPPRGPFYARANLGLPEGFMFLYLFDFWSGERKNPEAVVEAFSEAFTPGEGPTLVLKSINGVEWEPRRLERLTELAGGRVDIVLRDGYVSGAERDSYMASCNCYVSLHRSEGFGLTMAEAMVSGKPVIATGYSGNLEFMSDHNSFLVPYRLVEVPETWWAYARGAKWAEPDVEAASRLMRWVWEHQEEAASLGFKAQMDLLTRFSYEQTSCFIDERLVSIRTRGALAARSKAFDARPAVLDASRELARGIGASLSTQHGSRAGRLARRLLLRALWPYLEDQRRFDASMLDALESIYRSVDELERRAFASERNRADQASPD